MGYHSIARPYSCGRLACRKRKRYQFSWTEPGAKHTEINKRLIVTCRLRDISPVFCLSCSG